MFSKISSKPFSVNGGWSFWESWSTCSLNSRICSQSRKRNCNNPTPAGTGLLCVGEGTENQPCDAESCDSKYWG